MFVQWTWQRSNHTILNFVGINPLPFSAYRYIPSKQQNSSKTNHHLMVTCGLNAWSRIMSDHCVRYCRLLCSLRNWMPLRWITTAAQHNITCSFTLFAVCIFTEEEKKKQNFHIGRHRSCYTAASQCRLLPPLTLFISITASNSIVSLIRVCFSSGAPAVMKSRECRVPVKNNTYIRINRFFCLSFRMKCTFIEYCQQ